MKHSWRLMICVFVLAFMMVGFSITSSPAAYSAAAVESGNASVFHPGGMGAPILVAQNPGGTGYSLKAQAEGEAVPVSIVDPIQPYNRAIYHVNDKLYFWLLKPAARGYKFILPEPARVSVRNFFWNLNAPVRFLNCILQGNIPGSFNELFRFTTNSTLGVAGFFDPANSIFGLEKKNEDFGQTLGVYGAGNGFYLSWPYWGPSSLRDTVGLVVDSVVYPLTYLSSHYFPIYFGLLTLEAVNEASLTLGEYEELKSAAIDPYIAIRDAYVQYRENLIKER